VITCTYHTDYQLNDTHRSSPGVPSSILSRLESNREAFLKIKAFICRNNDLFAASKNIIYNTYITMDVITADDIPVVKVATLQSFPTTPGFQVAKFSGFFSTLCFATHTYLPLVSHCNVPSPSFRCFVTHHCLPRPALQRTIAFLFLYCNATFTFLSLFCNVPLSITGGKNDIATRAGVTNPNCKYRFSLQSKSIRLL
jgi:hypothetical protein